LATILFTDIVESTSKLSEFGDKKWSEILDEHDVIIKEMAEKYSGNYIKSTGDGALLVFDGPIRGITCAVEIKKAIKFLGIESRCGLHLGNIEWRGEDISGMAVNIAARVMDIDKGNDIVITKNLADLISGSEIKLKRFGQHKLKGIKDDWTLFKVSL
jgi:class 3 adenylate cyclase